MQIIEFDLFRLIRLNIYTKPNYSLLLKYHNVFNCRSLHHLNCPADVNGFAYTTPVRTPPT